MNVRSEIVLDTDILQIVPQEYVDSYVPASLNREALYMQLHKYDLNEPNYDREAFKRATVWLRRHFFQFVNLSEIISFEEAVGLQTASTSPGPLYRKYYDNKGVMAADPQGMKVLRDFSNLMKECGGCETYWGGILKDELRPKAKVLANKTRLFTSCSMPMCVVTAQVCHGFNKKFIDTALQSSSCVGVSKFNGGFNNIFSHLSTFKTGNGLDGTNFDGSIFTDMFWEIAQFRYECLSSNDQREYGYMLCNVYDSITQSIMILADGLCVQKLFGNPSGSFNTIVDNTLSSFIIFAYLWIRLGFDWSHFNSNVRLALVGDDNTFTVSDRILEYINSNFTKCLSIIHELGFTFTASNPQLVPLAQLDFLSHTVFRECGMWLPLANINKLWCSACYAPRRPSDFGFRMLRLCALRVEGYYNTEFRVIISNFIQQSMPRLVRSRFRRLVLASFLPDSIIVSLYRGDESAREFSKLFVFLRSIISFSESESGFVMSVPTLKSLGIHG